MFTLPELSYAYNALEPHIDEATMKVHHDKHHQAYLDKFNAALGKYPDLMKKPVEQILGNLNAVPEDIRMPVRNNGGGYYHHSLFWEMMSPNGGGTPAGKVAKAINDEFGGFDKFKEVFTLSAMSLFGSGWTWLVRNSAGKLSIINTPNQDSPVSQGLRPIIAIDVWEHAYYLKYQNRRADYIASWWNVASWRQAEKNFI
jgi:Fe-Mn family superoxide dismutase